MSRRLVCLSRIALISLTGLDEVEMYESLLMDREREDDDADDEREDDRRKEVRM